MQELDHCRKLTLLQPEGTRRVGENKLRWLELVQDGIKKMGMRNWRRKYVSRPRTVEGNFRRS